MSEWFSSLMRRGFSFRRGGAAAEKKTPGDPAADEPSAEDRAGTVMTNVDLGSMGLMESEDGTAAFSHASASPSNYYYTRYGRGDGMNMDRGGFQSLPDGTHTAAIFDGVTSGGPINAYAAQAFTEYTLATLFRRHTELRHGRENIQRVADEIWAGCASKYNNPARKNPSHEAEGGSATGAFVTVERCSDTSVLVNGSSIGDVSVFGLDLERGEVTMLNKYQRRGSDPRDTGGQICMCVGVQGKACVFSVPYPAKSMVVLATDGLTDNIHAPDLLAIVALVVRAAFFDTVPEDGCQLVRGAEAHLPTLAELQALVGSAPLQASMSEVRCSQAVARLSNYVMWVTEYLRNQEQEYYLAEHRREQLVRQRSTSEELTLVEQRLEELIAWRREGVAGKSDDAMVIAILPTHSRCPPFKPVPMSMPEAEKAGSASSS